MNSHHPAPDFKKPIPKITFAAGNLAAGFRASSAFGGAERGPLERLPDVPPPSADDGLQKHQAVRLERHALLAEARDLLLAQGQKLDLQWWHTVHRTAGCQHIRFTKDKVGISHDHEHGRSFLTGVQQCGSVWSCPLCAAKIQERRRLEIAQGMNWAYLNGLKAVMVTLTFPHRKHQKLDDLLEMQSEALKRLRKGKTWDKFKEAVNFTGLIRSLELTYGEDNGWHPHTHELWFVDADADADYIKNKVINKWKNACRAAGLLENGEVGFDDYSVDIKDKVSTSDYLAKQDSSRHWGSDREMAKATSKAGKKSGKHPFAFLEESAAGDEKSGWLYVQFSMAMRGKRQIFWSRGLKKLVGIEDKTDEEITDESREDQTTESGQFEHPEWEIIRDEKAQGEIISADESGGWPSVQRCLNRLKKKRDMETYVDFLNRRDLDPCFENQRKYNEYLKGKLSLYRRRSALSSGCTR